MKTALQIFKNGSFGEVRTTEENGKILFCGNDVAKALGYSNPNKAINDHCRAITKRDTPISGKMQAINFIPEGDLYRLVSHSKLPQAEQFETWGFDEVIPAIRKTGSYQIKKGMTDYQQMMAKTRADNAHIRKAQVLTRLSEKYKGTTYEQVLDSYATKEITGEHILPLPKSERKTFSATEIGKIFGVSANKIGTLAKANNLKTDKYGQWFHDKSKYSSREVETFRYYDNALPVFEQHIKMGI